MNGTVPTVKRHEILTSECLSIASLVVHVPIHLSGCGDQHPVSPHPSNRIFGLTTSWRLPSNKEQTRLSKIRPKFLFWSRFSIESGQNARDEGDQIIPEPQRRIFRSDYWRFSNLRPMSWINLKRILIVLSHPYLDDTDLEQEDADAIRANVLYRNRTNEDWILRFSQPLGIRHVMLMGIFPTT